MNDIKGLDGQSPISVPFDTVTAQGDGITATYEVKAVKPTRRGNEVTLRLQKGLGPIEMTANYAFEVLKPAEGELDVVFSPQLKFQR